MSLVEGLKSAFTAVANQINTLGAADDALNTAMSTLASRIDDLEAQPVIVVSPTEPPAVEGTIWLDTSGT